MKSQKEWKY